jgi:tetratricopeptide (TPR) repeat protein
MSPVQSGTRRKAEALYKDAIAAYERWDMDVAVEMLEQVISLHPDNPSYHMSLAQALSRAGDFDRALRALANYLRLAPNSKVADRVEHLFASGMDPVEAVLTDKMTEAQMPIEMIGAAIQMWIEFRIALGEDPLRIPKPEAWAAALDYTVRKVNLRDVPMEKIADYYGVSEDTLRKHNQTLIDKIDVMPCDYRYFTSDQNPLDKLVEAAELLERLEARFNKE